MPSQQYNRYKNIIEFGTIWRKYRLDSEILQEDAFNKEIIEKQFIFMNFSEGDKKIRAYLFIAASDYDRTSAKLANLLKDVPAGTEVILITSDFYKGYPAKLIKKIKDKRIYNYRHNHFDLVIPRAPLCGKHRIMSIDEVNTLLVKELHTDLLQLPKILESDPQCIWIGAKLADVLEITSHSEVSGEYIHYRLVISNNIGNADLKKEEIDEDEEVEAPEEKKEEDPILESESDDSGLIDDGDDADVIDED